MPYGSTDTGSGEAANMYGFQATGPRPDLAKPGLMVTGNRLLKDGCMLKGTGGKPIYKGQKEPVIL